MKILITGAAGRIGAHLTRSALRAGHTVRGLIVPGDARAEAIRLPGVDLVEGDLRDRDALRQAAAGVDAIVHLAGALTSRGNTDREFIEASKRQLGVPFDVAIVASEIGSYKPAPGHWQAFEREVGRLPDVHVGASHFHDVVPANGLGLPTVWVNRLAERGDPPPTREIRDLTPLADALDELVPA